MKTAPTNENLYNIIIKTTNFCCLECDYCYIEPHQSKFAKSVLSLEIVTRILLDYLEIINNQDAKNNRIIKLTWHGGEPLMAGLPYFREIVKLEKKLIKPPYKVINSITTNGTLLDMEWIEFFKRENFQVGISLDGPEYFHNLHRKYHSGIGSFDKVFNAITLLKEQNVPYGILTVITSELSKNPKKIFDFFVSNELKNVNFIPFTTPSNWLSPDEYTNFLIQFFDLWYKLDDPTFYIRDFVNILARIFGNESNLCEYSNCFGNYLGLDTNGDIYMCDLLIGNSDFLLSNIMESSLQNILSSEKYKKMKLIASKNAPSCQTCLYFMICTGGCMYRRYLATNSLPGKDIYCSSRKSLISHMLYTLEQDRVKLFSKTS